MHGSMAHTSRTLVLLFLSLLRYVCGDDNVDFPPLLDADDIAYFFQQGDLDGLEWALQNVFRRSARNPSNHEIRNPQLPDQLVSRGGGSSYTTAYKLQHDIEQAEYLVNVLSKQDEKEASFFSNVVIPAYQTLLSRVPSLERLERTFGLYPFSQQDGAEIGSLYNKALHQTNIRELVDERSGKHIPLINPHLDVDAIERQWFGDASGHDKEHAKGILYIDELLSPEALAAIQRIMWESTVWYQTKMPLKFGGYVGAYIDDGLHDRILLQLAMELSQCLPRIFRKHPLRYMWAYKYDSTYSGINLHADQAAVNVNIYLTPNEANLDPDSGGLVVFTAKPPADWDFVQFNTDTDLVRTQLLEPTGYANVTIPYRLNRAVIFDSALFHQTDSFHFRPGYKNRRINLTLLYGSMQQPNTADTQATASGETQEL